MREHRFLAFDVGAESGRAVVGTLAEGRLALEEILRFPNEPLEVCDTLHWDALCLYSNILQGLREYVRRYGAAADGIGVDTWALDFGLLGRDGKLLQNPVHYRDRRTEGMEAEVTRRMSAEVLYQRTGITLLPIYTLCQMLALRLSESPLLSCATGFLMMPDLLAYFLTGVRCCERTNAITTNLYDPRIGQWSDEIFRTLGLPRAIMPELVDPGTVLGEPRGTVKDSTGLQQGPVIAACTHDTGSAVAAVPGEGEDWAFLSSGTWSVLGMLTDQVVTTEAAFAAGVCNELTAGSFFLCRNIMGLWLLQQARAGWLRRGQPYSYGELVELARQAPAGGPMVHPDDPSFLAPADMLQAIHDYCVRTGQHTPEGPGEITRCILDSLSLCYRRSLDTLASLLGRCARVLHIVGGGSRNTLLCQLTADAAGIPVIAGPAEATVAGNVLVQALARGYLSSPTGIRQVVRRSSELTEYQPGDSAAWDDRYSQYRRLVAETGP